MMACQQISRRPWVGEAVEKWPKTKSRHPVSQRHLQTARVGVPEPPIVLARAELRVVAYVESFTPLPRRESSSFRGRWGAIGPACGRRAAWQRAVESRLRKPVTVGPFGQDSSRYPYIIAPAEPDWPRIKKKQKTSPTVRGGFFSSGSFHRRDPEFQRENPDPVLPPLFLTDLCCTSKVAQLCAGSLNGSCAQTNSARGEKNNNRGGSQSGPRLSPLGAFVRLLPDPPLPPHSPPSLHISRGPLIGWPHVAAST